MVDRSTTDPQKEAARRRGLGGERSPAPPCLGGMMPLALASAGHHVDVDAGERGVGDRVVELTHLTSSHRLIEHVRPRRIVCELHAVRLLLEQSIRINLGPRPRSLEPVNTANEPVPVSTLGQPNSERFPLLLGRPRAREHSKEPHLFGKSRRRLGALVKATEDSIEQVSNEPTKDRHAAARVRSALPPVMRCQRSMITSHHFGSTSKQMARRSSFCAATIVVPPPPKKSTTRSPCSVEFSRSHAKSFGLLAALWGRSSPCGRLSRKMLGASTGRPRSRTVLFIAFGLGSRA